MPSASRVARDVVAEVAHAAGRVDGRVLGAAEAAQIDRDDAQVVREILHDLLPEQRRTTRCRGCSTTVRSGGVGGVVALALEDVDVQSGASRRCGRVMPSKRVMGGSFAVDVGAPAPPISSTIAPRSMRGERPFRSLPTQARGIGRLGLAGVEADTSHRPLGAPRPGRRRPRRARRAQRVGRAAVEALPSSLSIHASAASGVESVRRRRGAARGRAAACPSRRRSRRGRTAPRIPSGTSATRAMCVELDARSPRRRSPRARPSTQVTPPPYSHVTR